MIKKILLSIILSLITIFSFSIVNRSCAINFYGIFSIWLTESTGFHEYLFFLYGFLINLFILSISYFIIFYLFKIILSKKLILTLIIVLVGLYVHFVSQTNIRLHIDSRHAFPKEFKEDNIDRKITFFFINKDVECPD